MKRILVLIMAIMTYPIPSFGEEDTVTTRMSKLDTDDDNRISIAESAADKRLAEQFEELDLNADGFLELVEMVQYESLN